MKPPLSIIIPVLNEAEQIAPKLLALQGLREQCELLLVDGGSDDDSADIAQSLVDRVLQSQRGRAKQMNAGAQQATANILLFLHADTTLPDQAQNIVLQAALHHIFH